MLVQQVMFPNAKYVVDPFHYTKCVMEALDKINEYTKGSLKNTSLFKQLKVLETLLNKPSTVVGNFIGNFTNYQVFTSGFVSFIDTIDINVIKAPKMVKLPINFCKVLKDIRKCTLSYVYKHNLKLDKNTILHLFLKRR